MPGQDPRSISPLAATAGGVAAGGSLVFAAILFQSNLALFLGILVPLLALLLGGYLFYVRMKRKKRTQLFNQGLQSNAAATPRGISDPNKIQKLDELRRRFDEGVKAFRSRNKDLTSLPWYMIVGEAGGGKTEAVRHSNIGFPPGLQDELQGIGGTINMNWWFSDNAVLLDTAGRLIFEEAPAGESTEWKEFLNLLKASRPHCPINGILLVIPCDSLVKDSEAEIERKARKLAEQLDTIQRVLDVRFPVSVLVTKADLLVGFREYFDDIRDPKLQHQMLGWSNPEKLDTPFKPAEVDRYLDELGERLRRRRLAMLRDPAPETAGGRRADEVDTLYALPYSISSLAPRLRMYLETLFKQGTWSLPPLFLRGIYFSSALREGAALDADLASALGVPLDSISDFKMWERERSFFLKDLFLEKIFREGGLVTQATDTKKMLRRRKLWLFGGGTAAIALFLAIAWMGMRSFEMSIKSQSAAWRPVAESGWTSGVFGRSLIPVRPDGTYERARLSSVCSMTH
jgi:type VI protein secretion system component VasK